MPLRCLMMVTCVFLTNRKYVGINACLNLNASLPGASCAMTLSQLRTCPLCNYARVKYHANGSALILIEYMERCRLALDEQEVRCYWCMFEFECVIACYTMRHDTIAIADLRWCWLNVWNGIVLALGEQKVRWYWFIFEFARVMTWYAMHYTRSQLHTCLLFK